MTDNLGIALDLANVLQKVGLGQFSDALWKTDSGLTYPEIIGLSMWALTGAPAESSREGKEK